MFGFDAMFGYSGVKVVEGRETFIPELDLLIQNYSGTYYLFSDSLAYQSTVKIKAAFTFLSFFNLLILNCHIDKKETVVYLPNSLEHQPN